MYIETLTLENFRCFEHASLTLNHPARQYSGTPPRLKNVNLLLGENGAGKTSIARAAVIAVLAPIIKGTGFFEQYLVRRKKKSAKNPVEARLTPTFYVDTSEGSQIVDETLTSGLILPSDGEGFLRMRIKRIRDRDVLLPAYNTTIRDVLSEDDSSAFFLVGYGANRRTERPEGYSERNRSLRYQRVASLFEDHVGLVPIAYAALQLQKRDRFDEARELLNALLPPDVQLTTKSDAFDNPLFDSGGVPLPFTALSDGYRTFIGWVWDMLVQIARVAPAESKLVDLPGVVIVDEIDLFLHPKWQREVIEKVATTFPNLQFLFSTHSPIVATTLEPANIFITENGKIEQFTESISGKSIDEALTSPYFGLASPRSPEMERELSQLAEQAMNGDFQASLEYLRRLRTGTEAANGTKVP